MSQTKVQVGCIVLNNMLVRMAASEKDSSHIATLKEPHCDLRATLHSSMQFSSNQPSLGVH